MPPVHYTRRALARLKYIGEWIEKDNPAAAQRVIAKISAAIALLGNQPEMGRLGRIGGTRELVVGGIPYIVAYRIKASGVEIVTILHASQQWPERFYSMSPESGHRFRDQDMRKNKELKHGKRI